MGRRRVALLLPLLVFSCSDGGVEDTPAATAVVAGSADADGRPSPEPDGGDGGDGPTVTGQPSPTSSPDGGSSASNNVQIGAVFTAGEFSFGRVAPGNSATMRITVDALWGIEARVTDVVVESSGEHEVFALSQNGCAGAAFPGPPCEVTIVATPPDAAAHRGTVVVLVEGAPDVGHGLVVSGGAGPQRPGRPSLGTVLPAPATGAG